ncbi:MULTISPECIES: glycosyltransferase family 2 protein [Pantoea]|jgi:glycosyltransferase involved in cell wall biosynthesis|uniref:glycosyltransferase family 2 protein n=1 Tax=Pantoea TaxID=53335 RepID=UPI001F33DD34|nr:MULTISPECIES: glycosyltransferase [Pantoea]UIL51173.1 glycosyltransferase [Pantoea agglomerans]
MSDILLSVIIPTYNVEKYIVECVDSLLRQVKAPNEIIIVNDGSTDGTLALIEQNYSHLSQVKVITIENGGLGNARDTGIALAQGEFLFFCDPDDVVVDGLVAELATVAEKHPQTDLFCFNSCVYEDGHIEITSPKVKHDQFGLQPPQEAFMRLLRNGSYTSAVWNYAIKKSVIEQHKLRFVRRIHEDHNFTLAVFMKCQQAWVSRQVYYKQRIRSGSLTNSTKGDEFFFQRYDAFMHAYNTLSSSQAKSEWRATLEKAYLTHSFRLMIYLSLYNQTPVPEYVRNAIRFMGRDVKTQNFKEWLLFNQPDLFIALQRYKVKKEINRAA